MPYARWLLLSAAVALPLTAADESWKNKQFPEWTEADAKQVITESPWARSVTPTAVKAPADGSPNRTGASRGGLGIGMGGMGRAGIGSRRGDARGRRASSASGPVSVTSLTLRWESALPVRTAELKARDTGAPTVDEDHYAVAVYGIPRSLITDDSKALADELKKHATLKRYGKKDLKPSSVEILLREDGPVIVYRFPRAEEITWRDEHVTFDGEIGHLKFSQVFETGEMTFHGKLEL